MALACLACHAMDNSTDSFRMDGSFRMQNMSVRSVRSDDGRDGCGGVSNCFSKTHKSAATNRQHKLGVVGGLPSGDSAVPPTALQRGAMASFGRQQPASFGRQQPDVSLSNMVFPEPRLTRCHAVRRDLFTNWTVGEIETEFEGRQLCFNLSRTTA